MGYMFLNKEDWLYSIFYKNKRLRYLPSKEHQIVQTENTQIEVSRKTWTLTCKTRVKVTIFIKFRNDPTVITVTLPQAVFRKTPIEVQVLTKVLKVICSKVRGSS